jgi:hypothetical protein
MVKLNRIGRAGSGETAVFWAVAPCSLIQVYRRCTALMMEETSLTPTRLHGAATQKTAIFVGEALLQEVLNREHITVTLK